MGADPVEHGEVEARDGLVMQDILSDGDERPQTGKTDREPDGKVEAKIPAARKPRRDERPEAWVADPKLLHRLLDQVEGEETCGTLTAQVAFRLRQRQVPPPRNL